MSDLAVVPIDTESPRATLRSKAVRGLKIASLTTAGKTGVDVLAQLVLVRLLAPSHFGLFAFAQALSGFVSCLTDLAGQKFLIRSAEADKRWASTVFWTELGLGLLVAGSWALLAPGLLDALGKPEQARFAQALAIWMVAERLMLPRSLLDRKMQFGRVNTALFAGVLAGSGVLVGTAILGWGAWCFIAGLITRTVVTASFCWYFAGFLPLPEYDWEAIRKLLAFGGPLLLTTALTFAYTNIDYLIVGSVAGYSVVGLYYAAYRYPHYLNQFNVVLASVVFPSFSQARSEEQLVRGFRLLTRYSAALAFPVVIAIWTEGEWVILWVLGEKWTAALFAFQCFATLAALRLTLVHWSHVFVVRGRTKPLLLVSAVNLPLVAGAAWLGVRWSGLEGAALGVTAVSLGVLLGSCLLLLRRTLRFSYLEALSPVLRASLGAVLVMVILGGMTPASSLAAMARLAAGGSVYAGLLWRSCGGEISNLLREPKK